MRSKETRSCDCHDPINITFVPQTAAATRRLERLSHVKCCGAEARLWRLSSWRWHDAFASEASVPVHFRLRPNPSTCEINVATTILLLKRPASTRFLDSLRRKPGSEVGVKPGDAKPKSRFERCSERSVLKKQVLSEVFTSIRFQAPSNCSPEPPEPSKDVEDTLAPRCTLAKDERKPWNSVAVAVRPQ